MIYITSPHEVYQLNPSKTEEPAVPFAGFFSNGALLPYRDDSGQLA